MIGREKELRLKIDFTNFSHQALGLGRGLLEEDFPKIKLISKPSSDAVKQQYKSGKLPYLNLHKQDISEIINFAKVNKGRFENIAILGIGGSALGLTCLQTALNNPFHNFINEQERDSYPRLFVLDNIDPYVFKSFTRAFSLARTLFIIISKSGSTAETMSQYLIVKQLLIDANLHVSDHIVAITDKEKGTLRDIVREEGMTSFVIPDGVGGRFSVLTPVGLLPAAMLGIDIAGLLQGAGEFSEYSLSCNPDKNPALFMASALFLLYKKGYVNHVIMPYSSRLKDFADWFRQLWAESLGKRVDRNNRVIEAGPTPIKALGVTDQHSQVQLYVEGPRDKAVIFVDVKDLEEEVVIPRPSEIDRELSYLGTKSLKELLKAEMLGTIVALTDSGRPNCVIEIEKVSPQSMGQLFLLWELAVSYAGELLDINAYDQPGVEAGKKAAYALMGRKGFEEEAVRIVEKMKSDSSLVLP